MCLLYAKVAARWSKSADAIVKMFLKRQSRSTSSTPVLEKISPNPLYKSKKRITNWRPALDEFHVSFNWSTGNRLLLRDYLFLSITKLPLSKALKSHLLWDCKLLLLFPHAGQLNDSDYLFVQTVELFVSVCVSWNSKWQIRCARVCMCALCALRACAYWEGPGVKRICSWEVREWGWGAPLIESEPPFWAARGNLATRRVRTGTHGQISLTPNSPPFTPPGSVLQVAPGAPPSTTIKPTADIMVPVTMV